MEIANSQADLALAGEWLTKDDKGQSSLAIFARMIGAAACRLPYPTDPSDLGRCLRLLEIVPSWKARIHEMKECGSQWEALVRYWGILENQMSEEVGLNWEKGSRAPKTYELMKLILGSAEAKP